MQNFLCSLIAVAAISCAAKPRPDRVQPEGRCESPTASTSAQRGSSNSQHGFTAAPAKTDGSALWRFVAAQQSQVIVRDGEKPDPDILLGSISDEPLVGNWRGDSELARILVFEGRPTGDIPTVDRVDYLLPPPED